MLNKLVVFFSLTIVSVAHGELCSSWSSPSVTGEVDPSVLKEASGIAASTDGKNLFHVNDSGSGPTVYQTDLKGSLIKEITIESFRPRDMEELAMGPCGDNSTCLFVGDIGDNKSKRTHIEILALQEEDLIQTTVRALKRFKLVYPDGPHNAEAFVVDPQGDLYIFTKESIREARDAYPSKVFRLSKAAQKTRGNITLEKVGEIDIPNINTFVPYLGKGVTGAALSKDGKRLILLTYINAIEFDFDKLKEVWKSGGSDIEGTYQKIRTGLPRQQEAITFIDEGSQLVITSEGENGHFMKSNDIVSIKCEDTTTSLK